MSPLRVLPFAALLCAGCGSSGGGGNCSAGPSLPAPMACSFSDGGTAFPSPANCCTTDADCTFGGYQWSCCGQYLAIGMNVSAHDAFWIARADWSCAACGCALGGVKTQDGQVLSGFAGVAVSCVAGACLTHAETDGGAPVCQPVGNACLSSADCCSQNCTINGTCCVPGGCP